MQLPWAITLQISRVKPGNQGEKGRGREGVGGGGMEGARKGGSPSEAL